MRRQSGYTLLEVLVVSVVVAIALTIVVRAVIKPSRDTAVTGFATEFVSYADRLRALATGLDYSTLPVQTAIDTLPPEWIVDRRQAVQRHSLGGALTVSKINSGGVTGALVQLVATNIAPEACTEAVLQTAPRAHIVVVGTTTLKTSAGATVVPALVRTACNATATPAITWLLLL